MQTEFDSNMHNKLEVSYFLFILWLFYLYWKINYSPHLEIFLDRNVSNVAINKMLCGIGVY